MSGYALNFDGTSMMLPQKNITFGATWTVEMWIKPNNFDFGGLFGSYPACYTTTYGNGNLLINNSSGSNVNFGSNTITNQVWQHIAITHSNGLVVLYKNGSQAGSGNLNLNVGSVQCYIAGRPNHSPIVLSGAYRFRGQMDEVRIWRTARTADQISKNMKKRLIGNETELQALWTFDEGTGAPKDLTSGANHLSWVGNGGTWNQPTYVNSEIDFFKEKYLVKDNSDFKTYRNDTWITLGKTLTDSMFLLDGMDSIDGMLKSLDGLTNALHSLTSKQPELLLWTEEAPPISSTTIIPQMTSNTAPSGTVTATSTNGGYEPWKAFNSSILNTDCWYSQNTPSINNPEIIAYEFSSPKTIKKINIYSPENISINYSPKDFEIVAWNGLDWDILGSYNVTSWMQGVPKICTLENHKSYSKYGVRTTSSVGGSYFGIGYIEMFDAAHPAKNATIVGMPSSKFRYKVDFNGQSVIKDWTELTDQTVDDSVLISSAFLNSISPYKISVIAEEAFNSALTTNYGTITLYDTEPTLIATVKGQKLYVQIGDNELDKVRFRVSINKKQVYPATGDFTPLIQAPTTFDYFISASDIILGGMNLLEIIAEDEFGKSSSLGLNFFGDYSGLMFVDENGRYFSDNIGNVLNYMDFGRITGGQTTLPKKIRVVNKNGFPIHNLLLTMNAGASNSRSVIQISKTDSPFTPEDQLSYARTIEDEQEVPVFVRVVTNKDDQPHSGTFEIVVNADPV
ncbi:LamG domain-containing protein [Brevibacillus porteri]|uniref:LamG domain-containing protein n=1 Tax=Brevibacillus porteri TaxID=2126350 RepID=UPI0036416289